MTQSVRFTSTFNKPVHQNDLPRPAGIASFMRLPISSLNETGSLDACIVGVPVDTATSNRPGTRFGPREIRTESVMVRPRSNATGKNPFERMQVADIGDVVASLYNVKAACDSITEQYTRIISNKCVPVSLGGDHLITYPILRACAASHGPLAIIHVDAHSDTAPSMMGERLAHGTPFRCAWEDGILDNSKVVQVGLRGTGWSHGDIGWGRDQGWRVVQAEECWHKSLEPLMADIRAQIGDHPCYLSFDIDAIDPGFCPGTGTPEIGGLTSIQALEIIRGCAGLNIVGCDLVEVSPAYDTTGNTSLTGANLVFEMLCLIKSIK